MGREYYEFVSADPSKALPDLEFEEFCYVSVHLYAKKVWTNANLDYFSRIYFQ